MQLSDFHYHLPQERIAFYPQARRSASRLLYLDGKCGLTKHFAFSDILTLLKPNDLLVFNNTKVIPARLFGQKETGGKVELLIERMLDVNAAVAQIRASKAPKAGAKIVIAAGAEVEVVGREGEFYRISSSENLNDLLDRHGHMPLPPYIDRNDEPFDRERYQTVYAEEPGAVAAPTAGLHFDEPLLQQIKDIGIDLAYVTLHVGAGTFQPVRVSSIEDHRMHAERVVVSPAVCDQIKATRARGGRVVAVGTTSVRCLETASLKAEELGQNISAYDGDTDIFIYPGYQFRCVDAMITNFHLPESTLLMLVSAFAGRENILQAYQAAIDNSYRFFSYGDAMFIVGAKSATPA